MSTESREASIRLFNTVYESMDHSKLDARIIYSPDRLKVRVEYWIGRGEKMHINNVNGGNIINLQDTASLNMADNFLKDIK
ncbi:hypothetical protein [Vibrio casei]|uniref:hypothetical protein n=1 Tax=Vibrio casei TaxID=673372 RepID=UPI003F9DE428